MKPDLKVKKLKDLRRIAKTVQKLNYYNGKHFDMYDWVPVEKPRLLGYNLVLYYSEIDFNIKGMKLANKLLAKYTPNKQLFIKNKIVKNLVNKSKNKYRNYVELINDMATKGKLDKVKLSKFHYSTAKSVADRYIPNLKNEYSEREYRNKIDDADKHCFTKTTKIAWNGTTYDVYVLDSSYLLTQYLKLRVEPSYSTHRGIPKSEMISLEKKLDDKLAQEFYYAKVYGGKDSWYRHELMAKSRKDRHNVKRDLNKVVTGILEPDAI